MLSELAVLCTCHGEELIQLVDLVVAVGELTVFRGELTAQMRDFGLQLIYQWGLINPVNRAVTLLITPAVRGGNQIFAVRFHGVQCARLDSAAHGVR